MLKTRLQTALGMALFFASLFFINNPVLWFFAIASITLLISYEWRHMPSKIVARSDWQHILGREFLMLSIKSILLTVFAFFMSGFEAISITHNPAVYTGLTIALKIFSLIWVACMLLFLKKDITGFATPYDFGQKNPILHKILFKIMPFMLPVLMMMNIVHLLISGDKIAPIPFILLILGLVWLSDSLAYFCGKKWGKRKLAPNISPNKTWEGAIIGNILAILIIFIIYTFERYSYEGINFSMLFFISILAILAVLGDLFQSKLKRLASVKDSSQFLPGHGGFFDRFDAMIPVLLFSIF